MLFLLSRRLNYPRLTGYRYELIRLEFWASYLIGRWIVPGALQEKGTRLKKKRLPFLKKNS
jgi:hypothetical protein